MDELRSPGMLRSLAPRNHDERPPSMVYRPAMTTLEDIEKAVAELPPDQLMRFRAWFDELEATRFDQKIELDAEAGRLDRLAEQALADFRAGRAREL
jgi:hypothetical protein